MMELNIAVSIHRLARTGGIERYTWEVIRHLAARGHRVQVYAPSSHDEPSGCVVRRLRGGRPANDVRGALELVSLGPRATLKMLRIDRRALRYGPLGSFVAPGVMTAHSVHSAWVRERRRAGIRPSLLDRALMAVESLSYRLPRVKITACSPLCADEASEIFGVDRDAITVVTPAMDPYAFARRTPAEYEEARVLLGLEPDRLVVGIVANHAFGPKGVRPLIEAVRATSATLLVAGFPDRRQAEYEAYAMRCGSDVRFLGAVDAIREFFLPLDVFALPSLKESYGMAVHEAMACGVATVVSQTCGIAPLITPGRDALVVKPHCVADLADAFREFADDHRRAAVARAGAAWAHRRTWADVGAEIEQVLVEYAGNR